MRNFKITCLALATGSLMAAATSVWAADGPKVAWNLSTWGPKRQFTAGIEALAAHVSKETGGKFTIKIHYGGALSKPADNLDNIKAGAFEMAQTCVGYHPGKHPSITVLDLPGLPLADPDVHQLVHDAMYAHPRIRDEYKRWNAIPYLSVLQPQSEFMGTGEPPLKVTDFSGRRVRALGGTGAAMKNLGAVPTSVPAPEVYTSLERGVFSAVGFPYTYAFASYKIDEISKWYTTNLAPGSNTCPTLVALDAYQKLPKNYRDILDAGRPVAYAALKKVAVETDAKNLAKWKEKGLLAITYSDAELKVFEEKGAGPVWSAWVKDNSAKGVPAKELLDMVLAEAKKAKAKLGK
jgi:TRAP-type mannitol/chloroaromatic compound transport system substrate-binding protein